jgi:hypothetical protein
VASTPAPRSNTTRNIIIVLVVVFAVVILAVVGLLWYAYGSNVTVSGSVTTTGLTTHPVTLTFTSDNGQVYTATANGVVGHSGVYSVSLPKGHVYSVAINGAGDLGYTGTCNAGSFTISQGFGSSSLAEDWSC